VVKGVAFLRYALPCLVPQHRRHSCHRFVVCTATTVRLDQTSITLDGVSFDLANCATLADVTSVIGRSYPIVFIGNWAARRSIRAQCYGFMLRVNDRIFCVHLGARSSRLLRCSSSVSCGRRQRRLDQAIRAGARTPWSVLVAFWCRRADHSARSFRRRTYADRALLAALSSSAHLACCWSACSRSGESRNSWHCWYLCSLRCTCSHAVVLLTVPLLLSFDGTRASFACAGCGSQDGNACTGCVETAILSARCVACFV
jgi:hypothetical protein